MNLQQIKFCLAIAKANLNLTQAAKNIQTSQPGVSKSVLDLESELGISVFTRHGKRIKAITEPGKLALQSMAVIAREVENLRRIGEEFQSLQNGTLQITTTHTQARYVLPQPIARLREIFPAVNVCLHQGTPTQVAEMLLDGSATLGLATESLADYPELITLPCYEWRHVLVAPSGHPLLTKKELHLADLIDYPLITYHPSFTGRMRIDAAFAAADLTPRIALEAIDSDVIKTYVGIGLGVGIVAEMAFWSVDPKGISGFSGFSADGQTSAAQPNMDAEFMPSVRGEEAADKALEQRPLGHLFGNNTTRLAFRQGIYLRSFDYVFAELISPALTRSVLEAAAAQSAHAA